MNILNPNKTKAILIGTAKFADFNNMNPVENNIKEIANVLIDKTIFGISEKNVIVINDKNDNEVELELINNIKSAKEDGITTLILYFAGHGYRNREGKYFLATKNSKKELIRLNGKTAIAFEDIINIIKSGNIKQTILIIDASYSGTATQGKIGRNTYMITSSDATEISYFDEKADYTIFTNELLRVFKHGIKGKQYISLNDLYNELKISVKKKRQDMTPQQSASGIDGNDFMLFINKNFDEKIKNQKFDKNTKTDKTLNVENKEEEQNELILNSNFSIVNENVKGVLKISNLAKILSDIIEEIKDERGLMVGVFGKWGRGKTFLWKHIWEQIEKDKEKKYHKVEFHAWKYQETPASWAYLYETIAKVFYEKPKKWWHFLSWCKFGIKIFTFNIKRKGILPILKFILTIGIGIFLFFITEIAKDTEIAKTTIKNYENVYLLGQITLTFGFLAGLIAFFKKEYGTKATDLFKKYTAKHSYKDLLGFQAEIENELEQLLKFWSRTNGKFLKIKSLFNLDKKIILFVDDIDRCSEDRIIQVVDALKVLLENKEISQRLVILTAIDERILKRAIAVKYKNFLKDSPDKEIKLQELIREYMDKLFLLGIKLGKLNSEERIEIFENYTTGKIKILTSITENDKNIKLKGVQDISFKVGDNEMKMSELKPDKKLKDALNKDKEDNVKDETINTNEEKVNSLKPSTKIEKYEITNIEKENIINLLNTDIELTPRTIRIFYNRYLLAKNLLLNLKLNAVESTEWNKIEQKDGILIALILEFSFKNNIETLINFIKDVENETKEIINFKITGKTFSINRKLLNELLEITEMVVPY